jgi:hypothetical protein
LNTDFTIEPFQSQAAQTSVLKKYGENIVSGASSLVANRPASGLFPEKPGCMAPLTIIPA